VRIAVVGVGLIGGSVALAARERLGATVAGFDTDRRALAEAVRRGVLDAPAAGVADAVAGAEAAFVAVPVGALPETVRKVLGTAPHDCVVTDVGSTKRAVVAAADDERFVGGHPLAGAESAGVRYARSDLFEGATWYLTPTQRTSGILYERLHRILHRFGARPAAIDADAHDRILATVSHLPHVLANVLVSQAARTLAGTAEGGAGGQGEVGGAGGQAGTDPGERLPATGPSFRDATRVAGAPSSTWADIYLSNADALGAAISQTAAALARVERMLAAGDREAIVAWNEQAASDRRRLLEAQLAGGPLSELRVSVPNRPGVVAQLALELGRAGINIADLALYPAPDMSEGVVALWTVGEQAAGRAQALIERLGFPVSRP
jgi:prephenate dehydrogenase